MSASISGDLNGHSAPQLPSKLKHTLSNHTGTVNIVRYNHGMSRYCLSGGSDRSIRLWNPSAGKEVKVYQGHGYEVLGIDIASDNASFASCGGDKSILIWDVASGTVLRRLQGHFGKINVVKYGGGGSGGGSAKDGSSNVLLSGSFDSKVMVWDMRSQSRTPIQALQDARDSITSIATPSSLPEVIVGSVDGCVRTYDLRNGKMMEDTIGDSMLVSSLDSTLRLMDRSNGQLLAAFKHEDFCNTSYRSQVAYQYGEAGILAGDDSGKLFAWDVLSGKLLPKMPCKIHQKVILWIEHHPSSPDEMLTASADGTIKVWGTK